MTFSNKYNFNAGFQTYLQSIENNKNVFQYISQGHSSRMDQRPRHTSRPQPTLIRLIGGPDRRLREWSWDALAIVYNAS